MNKLGEFVLKQLFKSRTFQSLWLQNFAHSPLTTRTVQALAREGYEENPFVYSAIMMRSRSVAKMPPILYRVREGGRTEQALRRGYQSKRARKRIGLAPVAHRLITKRASEIRSITGAPSSLARRMATKELIQNGELEQIEAHPLLELLDNPNPYYQTTYSQLVDAYVGFRDLYGEIFTEPVVYDSGPMAGEPFEIYVHNPERFYPVTPDRARDRMRRPIIAWRFEYREPEFKYDPDPTESEIYFDKVFNPTNPLRGLSPLAVAGRAVDMVNETEDYNLNLLRQGGFPPMVLYNKSERRKWSKVKRDEFRDEWSDEVSGSGRAGMPLLLDGDVGAMTVGAKPKDLMFPEVTRLSLRQVAIVYNLAPELLGDDKKTYNNMKQARRALYVEAAMPVADSMFRHWNSTFVRRFGNDLLLDYNAEQVEELQDDMDAIYERVTKANDLTVNERRQLLGFEEVDGGDVILVSSTSVPLSMVSQTDVPRMEVTPEGEVVASGNPYRVERRGDEWVVVKITDGEVMGEHDTEDEAMQQFRALEASEDDEKSIGGDGLPRHIFINAE